MFKFCPLNFYKKGELEMTNNIVEFKKKEELANEELNKMKNEIKTNFLTALKKTEEEIMDSNTLRDSLLELIDAKQELVFKTENDALIFASAILDFPEFEHVSHFEVVPNISRKSTFFSIKPILKDEKKYVFADDEFLYSANLININRIKG
jgi:hypothetical protein